VLTIGTLLALLIRELVDLAVVTVFDFSVVTVA
jgi:hypothetical protein